MGGRGRGRQRNSKGKPGPAEELPAESAEELALGSAEATANEPALEAAEATADGTAATDEPAVEEPALESAEAAADGAAAADTPAAEDPALEATETTAAGAAAADTPAAEDVGYVEMAQHMTAIMKHLKAEKEEVVETTPAAAPPAAAEPSTEEAVEPALEVCGDYRFVSTDGQTEGVFLLKDGGQWWHAAHRTAQEIAATSSEGPAQSPGKEFQAVPVWEISESLGSWETLSEEAAGEGGTRVMLQLTCRHWNFKCSHDAAPSTFRPTLEGRTDLEEMVDNGQLSFCYAVRLEQGRRLLEMQARAQPSAPAGGGSSGSASRHTSMRSRQAAFQTLGLFPRYLAKEAAAKGGG